MATITHLCCAAGISLAMFCSPANAIDFTKELADAEKGDCGAMHNTGVLYASGHQGKPDYAHAMKWFQRAARQGNHSSMYSLGIMYRFGQGVEIDMAQASAWYALAAHYIPKNGDEWFTPRAKVAMFLSTAEEVKDGLTETQRSQAQSLAEKLRREITAIAPSCTG